MDTASTGFKKMNWVTKRSAWQDAQLVRQKRAAAQERIDTMNAVASGFQAAQTMQIQGIGELANQSAQTRLQTQVKEMQAKLDATYANFSKLA